MPPGAVICVPSAPVVGPAAIPVPAPIGTAIKTTTTNQACLIDTSEEEIIDAREPTFATGPPSDPLGHSNGAGLDSAPEADTSAVACLLGPADGVPGCGAPGGICPLGT